MKQRQGIREKSHNRTLVVVGMVFFCLLVPLILLVNWYKASLIRQEKARIGTQASVMANSLVFSVNQRLALLQGIYAFTRTEWPRADFDYPFEVFSSDLYFKSNGISTLMVAPEGIARYVYPLYNARKLSGYDVINDPDATTRADVQRAIHTREITLSEPGDLPEGGFGLRAWRAVYRGSQLWGLVSISLDLRTILKDVGLSNPSNGLELSLQDNSGHNFFGKDIVWQKDPVTETINLPEGTWKLGIVPVGGWEQLVNSKVLLFRLVSLLLLAFLSGIVYLVINRQDQQAQMAVLEERQRLAQELHDSVSQVLYSIGLGAKSARAALGRDSVQVESALEYIDRLAEGGQAEMRQLIFELRPDSISVDGLVLALERLCHILRTRHQMDVKAQFCDEPILPTAVKETIYRVAQEAVNNIVKHARASQVVMKLEIAGGKLNLEVKDNGIGFQADGVFPGHMGLRSMYERAAKNGARLIIFSSSDQGTIIECNVPYKKKMSDKFHADQV